MIGAFGAEVQVMDWGIAKILDERIELARRSTRAIDSDATTDGGDTSSTKRQTDDTPGETAPGVAKGTPAYMAPEQARGEKDRIGPPSDVFGLGGILCQMLTGQPTFTGVGVIERARSGDLSETFSRLDQSGHAPDLVALTKQFLDPDPAKRFANAGIAAEAVRIYQSSVVQRLKTKLSWKRPRPRRRRKANDNGAACR